MGSKGLHVRITLLVTCPESSFFFSQNLHSDMNVHMNNTSCCGHVQTNPVPEQRRSRKSRGEEMEGRSEKSITAQNFWPEAGSIPQ